MRALADIAVDGFNAIHPLPDLDVAQQGRG
jgi:hypothetical protein